MKRLTNTSSFWSRITMMAMLLAVGFGTAFAQSSWPDYDFKAANADGDTLYYRITSSTAPYTVAVTRCHDSVYHHLPNPTYSYQVGQPGFLYPVYDYDTLITIPSTVTYEGQTYTVTAVDKEAFYNQKGLHTVILPASVETIDTSAFYRSTLANIVMPNVKRIESCAFSSLPMGHVDLPSTLTFIGEQAFSYSSISEVDIPSGVEVLPKYAFYYNPITKITFHEGLREIGMAAFSPEYVDSLVFPSTLQSIDLYTHELFYYDEGREIMCEYVEFQNGTEPLYLKDYCFYHFGKLKTLILSDNIVHIGRSCFEKSNVKNFVVPYRVRSIHWKCFADCDSLQRVVLPDNLTTVETAAFKNTPLLKEVTMPASVTNVGSQAFGHDAYVSAGLEFLNCYGENPFVILSNTFNTQDTIYVRVPCGATAAYQSASGWNSYSNLIYEECVGVEEHEPAGFKIYPNPADEVLYVELPGEEIANVVLYDLQGRAVKGVCDTHRGVCDTPQQGNATINVRNLPTGVYILHVTDTNGKEYHQKVVVK